MAITKGTEGNAHLNQPVHFNESNARDNRFIRWKQQKKHKHAVLQVLTMLWIPSSIIALREPVTEIFVSFVSSFLCQYSSIICDKFNQWWSNLLFVKLSIITMLRYFFRHRDLFMIQQIFSFVKHGAPCYIPISAFSSQWVRAFSSSWGTWLILSSCHIPNKMWTETSPGALERTNQSTQGPGSWPLWSRDGFGDLVYLHLLTIPECKIGF